MDTSLNYNLKSIILLTLSIFLTSFSINAQSVGDVIVTEILQNPSIVNDADGEWFEVYNTTNSSIDLNGWIFSDNGSNTFTVSGSLIIPPKGLLVFGINDDISTNGGAPVDYQYSNFSLGNGADEIIIETSGGVEIDRVEYDGGPDFPDPSGASMILVYMDGVSNDLGSSWKQDFNNVFGDGDFGTPGLLNTEFVGDVIISEIMYDPLAVNNADGEWLEVYNTTNEDIDLSSWYFVSSEDGSDFMELPGLNLPANGYLVFGNNGDPTTNGGVTLDFDYSIGYTFSLTNGSNKIIMYSAEFALIDSVEFTQPGFPNIEGASIALQSLTEQDNDTGTNWIASQTPWVGSAGDLGSPGVANPPLPVTLTFFEAQKVEENIVQLSWQTASEENNDYFSIEHSTDGIYFRSLDKVDGKGTTSELQNYSYLDKNLESGQHYYRLKQVDFDGKYEYSKLITVQIKDYKGEVILSPNPASDIIFIQLSTTVEKDLDFQILNLQGQVVLSNIINLGDRSLELDISNLPTGIYYLKIFIGNKVRTKKIIKKRL